MIQDLSPSRYLDDVYGRGVHVVLLHIGDDLYREAHLELESTDTRLGEGHWIHLWECRIRTPEDCATVQACKFPQFRFIINGNERDPYLGVLSASDLLDRIQGFEDEP